MSSSLCLWILLIFNWFFCLLKNDGSAWWKIYSPVFTIFCASPGQQLHPLFLPSLPKQFWCRFKSLFLLVGVSLPVSLPLSFCSFDKQPMCWHGEAFRRAEMCQSRPCLSDYSFIWSYALTLRSNIFPFSCHAFFQFSFSLVFFPFSLFIRLHNIFSKAYCIGTYTHTNTPDLHWQVWYLSHAGHRRWMW